MSEERRSITEQGNPRKPQGSAGKEMLMGMNEHHGPVTAWGIDHFSFSGSERVLDIGCGGGAALRRMAEKVPSGHLTGVDYSKVSIALTSECNADLISQGRLNVVQGIVSELPFEDMRVRVPEAYDSWLRARYGEGYMRLPQSPSFRSRGVFYDLKAPDPHRKERDK